MQAARLVPPPAHHPRLHTPVLPSGESRTLQAARLCVEWWNRRTDTVPLHIDPALRTIIVVIIIPTFRSLHLQVDPPKYSYGVWRSAISSPSGNQILCILALKSDI